MIRRTTPALTLTISNGGDLDLTQVEAVRQPTFNYTKVNAVCTLSMCWSLLFKFICEVLLMTRFIPHRACRFLYIN